MVFALVGNPNCGKTALFNLLTGGRERVGNFPGVTVERKEGTLLMNPEITLIDLPGTYTLSPGSEEEVVTHRFLQQEKPDVLINVLDGVCAPRQLFLTLQLLELHIPMVLAFNRIDVVRKNGGTPDLTALSAALGIPVLAISALTGEGCETLMHTAITLAKQAIPPAPSISFDSSFASPAARYKWLEQISARCALRSAKDREDIQTQRIDRLLLGKYTGIPCFLLIFSLIFFLTCAGPGRTLGNWTNHQLQSLTLLLDSFLLQANVHPLLRSLFCDGLLPGVGSILSFLPTILTLFFLLALLEDSGYLARTAFLMDRPMRLLGLSGRAFVPLLFGFGCTVPAILATRTLSGTREKNQTLFLLPFLSCSAKLPVYAAFAAAIFPDHPTAIVLSLYFTGILLMIPFGLLNGLPVLKTPVPFLLELPSYRIPSLRAVFQQLLERTKAFLQKAFTWILFASALIWGLQHFNRHFQFGFFPEESLLAEIGQALLPLFRPLGFSDWRAVCALLTGLTAKETVLSTLAVLLGNSSSNFFESLRLLFPSAAAAYSFLLFFLLYSPCIACAAALHRELKSRKQTFFFLLRQTIFAWIVSFIFYAFAQLFF